MSELRVVIDSSFDAVPAVGEAARALCRREGMTDAEAGMIELGIVESVNNAIEHAYAGRSGGDIEVHLVVDAERVAVEITDEGLPVDPSIFAPSFPEFDTSDRATLPEGGFGIAIFHGIFDEVTFLRDGVRNRLTLRKSRRADA